MTMRREQIIQFIHRVPGRDDDEIARALGISPRQTVNLICRELAERGLIERAPGPRGKIVNRPATSQVSSNDVSQAQVEISPELRRPLLHVQTLIEAGFNRSGDWNIGGDEKLRLAGDIPANKGVYVFTSGEIAQYVGVASMGLKRRMYLYKRPGAKQSTNIRINASIRSELHAGGSVSVYTAIPPDFKWNGLTVNGRAGLEIGLIEAFHLPWNVRGATSA
jgi:hypothetical protein